MARKRAGGDGFTKNLRRTFNLAGGVGGGRPTYGGSSSSPDSREPLGVPEDYTVPYTRDMTGMSARAGEGWAAGTGGHGSIQERGPRYFDGDEYTPAGLGPVGIGELQEHMAVAGLLGDGWRYGIWDDTTASAYKAVLTEANAMGYTASQVIQMRQQSATFGGTGGSGGAGGGSGGRGGSWQLDENGEPVFIEEAYVPPPLELRTTNKQDLARAFRQAVIDTMGEGWSQAQIAEMVDAYGWKEIQVQKEAYDQQVAAERAAFEGTPLPEGSVISTVDVPSPDTFLEDELMRRDPVGFQSGKLVNEALPEFFNMMSGWSR